MRRNCGRCSTCRAKSSRIYIGGFTSFAKPMNAAGIAEEIRETGWPLFLLGLAVQGLILMYIAAIGLHITSIFLDFKETFGTACLVGLGSIGFRA
ncbi:MAG: hypothetical protein U1F77_12025 [Kiritimatiellia bacterium]